jgi:EAL domain-containing protein (putative c-di-GMP-specific phosphodiesterase class I)/ActR/RegA family two-component response regulator
VLDDDRLLTEALAAGLEREARTVITCNDLESAQLIVERMNPSHIVSDIRLTGPFAYEGLEFIRHVKRHSPESRFILMTGDAPEALQLEASERGAVAFLQKPFDVGELDSIINTMKCSALSFAATDENPIIRMPLLDEIISSDELRPLFQPIVKLSGDYPHVGYEALARYRNNAIFKNPEVLFQYAKRKDRVRDLELACVRKALMTGAQLTRIGPLFLNIHPDVLIGGTELRQVVAREAERYGVDPGRIVLEITEQASMTDQRSVFEGIEQLRTLGVRFAFDDVGMAYSHLPFIDKVRPSFLKISQHFGTSFETDPTRMKIVTNIQSLARDFSCDLIIEGIEHASSAQVAEKMGIKYGQGFHFARPSEAADWL